MSNEPVSPDPELSAIEAALGSLVPARSGIDRDRLMFLAGQAAARPSSSGRWAWIAIAASLAVLALGEAALLANRPTPRVIDKVIVVRVPASVAPSPEKTVADVPPPRPAASSLSLGNTAYERLASQVLRYGLDGLPASPTAAWTDPRPWPPSSGRLLHEELRKLLEPGDPS